MPPDRIVIATGNPHKVEELRAMLALPGVGFVGLGDLPGAFAEPAETGSTFLANATIKALSYAAQTGLPCLADDSGLEVDALGGAPGVISSHYSTNGVETGLSRAERDGANNARLLRELAGVPPEQRTARFVCQMVLAAPPLRGGALWAPSSSTEPPLSERFLTDREFRPRQTDLLPHGEKGGSAYFITFCLEQGTLTEAERAIALNACLFWHPERIRLHLVVVMPDHVHMLFTPVEVCAGRWPSLPWLMQSIKSFSSREINRLHGRSGKVWQDEYRDEIIRDREEFYAKLEYTGLNPVRAGLAEDWLAYRWIGGEEVERAREAAGRLGGIGERRPGRRGGGPECPAPEEADRGIERGESILATSRGTFEGRIGLPGEVPRGENGFGYDPLFMVAPMFVLTSAELAPEEKNRLSHRGAAATVMLEQLRQIIAR
jgi:non-canonical purine NTP pyrophosphatase (RdgB/HAM1 family)